MESYVFRTPKRFSGSYHPPTTRTAALMPLRCGRMSRSAPDVGAHVHELSLRHVAAAHVLVDQDVTVLEVPSALSSWCFDVVVRSVGAHAVRRALQKDGVLPSTILRCIDRRKELGCRRASRCGIRVSYSEPGRNPRHAPRRSRRLVAQGIEQIGFVIRGIDANLHSFSPVK